MIWDDMRQDHLEKEYRLTVRYYKNTVWGHVSNLRLSGAQYDVAAVAFARVLEAREKWIKSLPPFSALEANARAETALWENLRPRRLERDDTITAEHLATLASQRLGSTKPRSTALAIEEAHNILLAARDYIQALPSSKDVWDLEAAAFLDHSVSFDEIVNSANRPGCFPLLPTVQRRRNEGKLTRKALEQALERHARGALQDIQQELRKAIKIQEIRCGLLEEVRWRRFQRHNRR